ncbi:type II toxin-antitoxin system death-on-curing family toxin [Caloramator proteoclasticus]|uniref:Death on curing protein n=1 Tax=Caloramator proteoclasticus DSM 10124 TaxID=1121262 RepID=A0A1M4YUZ5_9CLOT|nr:type II toxin-antitoxin system death-on-curing family toxin [Caloramator proteoclasticus]SHF09644.1 death on curing protein [Caloramator proteoclasticus DSM 10124]
MKYIGIPFILKMYQKMIEKTGGTYGLRSIELLESAIENSKMTFEGVELYPSIEEKCANICFSIINNHPFIDGNKRMGIYIMLVLLEYNNVHIKYTQEELVKLGLDIACGNFNSRDILNWINTHKI